MIVVGVVLAVTGFLAYGSGLSGGISIAIVVAGILVVAAISTRFGKKTSRLDEETEESSLSTESPRTEEEPPRAP